MATIYKSREHIDTFTFYKLISSYPTIDLNIFVEAVNMKEVGIFIDLKLHSNGIVSMFVSRWLVDLWEV